MTAKSIAPKVSEARLETANTWPWNSVSGSSGSGARRAIQRKAPSASTPPADTPSTSGDAQA